MLTYKQPTKTPA